jgi:nucleoid DNA-binding protein
MGLLVALSADAQPPAPPAKSGTTASEKLEKVLARVSKVKEDDISSVLKALGPILRDKLRAGETVEVPGLGQFRIVRIQAHRDLIKGIPGEVPGNNVVEFLSQGDLTAAANGPGAVPAVIVPPAEFTVNPNTAPSSKADPLRTQRSRAGR